MDLNNFHRECQDDGWLADHPIFLKLVLQLLFWKFVVRRFTVIWISSFSSWMNQQKTPPMTRPMAPIGFVLKTH